jgi:hypothetical protein
MSYSGKKSKVTKKRSEGNRNNSDDNDNKSNKLLVDKKCIGYLDIKKRIIIKEDGRYLIYYTF